MTRSASPSTFLKYFLICSSSSHIDAKPDRRLLPLQPRHVLLGPSDHARRETVSRSMCIYLWPRLHGRSAHTANKNNRTQRLPREEMRVDDEQPLYVPNHYRPK